MLYGRSSPSFTSVRHFEFLDKKNNSNNNNNDSNKKRKQTRGDVPCRCNHVCKLSPNQYFCSCCVTGQEKNYLLRDETTGFSYNNPKLWTSLFVKITDASWRI